MMNTPTRPQEVPIIRKDTPYPCTLIGLETHLTCKLTGFLSSTPPDHEYNTDRNSEINFTITTTLRYRNAKKQFKTF